MTTRNRRKQDVLEKKFTIVAYTIIRALQLRERDRNLIEGDQFRNEKHCVVLPA